MTLAPTLAYLPTRLEDLCTAVEILDRRDTRARREASERALQRNLQQNVQQNVQNASTIDACGRKRSKYASPADRSDTRHGSRSPFARVRCPPAPSPPERYASMPRLTFSASMTSLERRGIIIAYDTSNPLSLRASSRRVVDLDDDASSSNWVKLINLPVDEYRRANYYSNTGRAPFPARDISISA